MKKKVVWLVVSCWMVAALLLASCAPAVVKEEEEKVAPPVKEEEVVVPKEVVVPEKEANMVKWTGTKLDGTVVEKMIEKPRYGGIHITARTGQPVVFDDIVTTGSTNWPAHLTNDSLLTRNWTKGPLGTGEWSAQNPVFPAFGIEVGLVAESWELVDPDTLVYHIRQGIHWQDKPPLNGRELTADDVVFSLRRNWEVGYQSKNYQYLIDMKNVANSIYVSPTDKWAVHIKNLPQASGPVYLAASSLFNHIIAPETVAPDYKKANTDWKGIVGNGAFILQDYVGASALTYVRNPNYWMHDPFFPENQLPYIDSLKILIIPDKSTLMAALRTGKIDNLYPATGSPITAEDAESLMKTTPELEWVSYLGESTPTINMRVDKPELPFYDVRVRRALNMAIDKREILNEYYGGKGELFTYPIPPLAEYEAIYIPLEKMPESVRELFEYHPDKARQLLAEAGYPNGFKTEALCWSAEDVDLLSLVKDYWAKIGVDLKIDVRDFSVYEAMRGRKSYTQMIRAFASGSPYVMSALRLGSMDNYSMVNEPESNELYKAIQANYFDEATFRKLYTEPTETRPNFITWANEQAFFISLPSPYSYVLWQPWLKGYGGAINVTWWGGTNWPMYVWIDQELKGAMGR